MRPIAASYDELCDEVLASLDLSLEERAIERAERSLATCLSGRRAVVDGVPCAVQVLAGTLVLTAPGRLVRVLRLDQAEAAHAAVQLVDLPPEAGALLDAARRGRTRRRQLLERRRLVKAKRAVTRRRRALGRLGELEVAVAEKLRRRLVARERTQGAPADPSLERTVPEIVSSAARRLADESRAIDDALARCASALADTESIRSAGDAAVLDGFASLSRLLVERIALEYRRFERALVRDLRAFAEGVPEGGADVPLPTQRAARSGPLGDTRLVQRLAFLMTKANFVAVPRRDLERGFSIGPAPGVRLTVPLEEARAAHFFARGIQLEPLPGGGAAPCFERFAYCWLERDEDRIQARRRRPAGGFLSRLRRRMRVLLFRDARRRIAPSVRRAVAVGRVLAATPVNSATDAPPIAIKIFADVRLGECGLLLPGAAIKYRARDLVLVLGGVLGGLWSKLSASPLALILTPQFALPLFGVAAFRGLMGMRRSRVTLDKLREEYENRHLLATRLFAVDYFMREAAETDAKEALAAYAAALQSAIDRCLDLREPLRERPGDLRGRIETRLSERAERAVRFDLEDAIGCLEACGLLSPPGFFAPGESEPDFFDPRVTGETVKREAETLFASAPGPAPESPPAGAADSASLEGEPGLRAALARMEGRQAERGPAAPPPAEPWPAPEVSFLSIDEAVRRVRKDLRRRLDLEDEPPGAGASMGAAGDVEGMLGERFTL